MSRGDLTMVVGSSQVGKIIGRKGANIRELEADTGARIKIAKEEHEPGLKTVDIIGSPEQIDRAKVRIESCLSSDFEDERRGGGGGGGGFGSFGGCDDFSRRRERGGGFGGGFGGGRRDDRRGFGGGRREDGGDRWGGKDDFQRGGGGRRGFNENSESDSMYVDSQEVGKIIGRGGCRIREMESHSGCQIKVSRDSDSRGCCEVSLRGSLDQIGEAKRLIGECL